jgi:hypothetical protein
LLLAAPPAFLASTDKKTRAGAVRVFAGRPRIFLPVTYHYTENEGICQFEKARFSMKNVEISTL